MATAPPEWKRYTWYMGCKTICDADSFFETAHRQVLLYQVVVGIDVSTPLLPVEYVLGYEVSMFCFPAI